MSSNYLGSDSKRLATRKYRMRYFREEDEAFRSLKNTNILIYFPHGFGDCVFLSYILPFFEPTNKYWITRYGDTFTCLMEGNNWLTPLYTGIHSTHCDHGGAYFNRHFGVNLDEGDGNEKEFELPLPLYEACVEHQIETVFQTGFTETWGETAFPYHTKARRLIPRISNRSGMDVNRLKAGLKSTISFETDGTIQRLIEAKLRNILGNRKLCLIGRNGYTAVGKNWGHLWREDLPSGKQIEGEECRDFIRLMLRRDPNWFFLVIEDRLFEGEHTVRSRETNTFSYAEIFGSMDSDGLPFGLVMKILICIADLAVGVPAGPYHLCMAYESLPTVGIWIEHLPSWYDEPNSASIHVLSQNIKSLKLMDRPGSFESRGALTYRSLWSDSRTISGEAVLSAVETLLY